MAAKKKAAPKKKAPAVKKAKPPKVEKAKVGRPTDYRDEYADQALKFCLLGADDADLARMFDVDERTINRWKEAHPAFCQSIKEGKDEADAKVADSLYHRARGYSHPEVHVSNYQGEITLTPLVKHYPPDATSAIFWLKNRQKGKWRDKTDVEHSGDLKVVALSATDTAVL